jgi:serine/threonine-protein kinase
LSFTLEKESILVGREDRRSNIFPEVDLTKFDVQAKVSRRHARIWREGAEFLVEDLKSSNGTVLITDDNKNVRLQANEPHILRHGDKLRLGETTLRFYLG